MFGNLLQNAVDRFLLGDFDLPIAARLAASIGTHRAAAQSRAPGAGAPSENQSAQMCRIGMAPIANDQKKLDASIKSLSERLGKLAKLRRDIEANVAPYVRPTPAQIPAARARPRLVSSA